MVDYSLLQRELPNYQLHCYSNKSSSFYNCNILLSHTQCKSGTLYIGYSKDLQPGYLAEESFGFLLMDEPEHDTSEIDATIIYSQASNVDLMELFHDVQCIFQDNLTCLNTSSQFIDAFLHEKSIPELIEISSQMLGNPIMFTDSSFKIIYMTKDQIVEDKVWEDAKELGNCSAESILLFKNDKASSLLFNSNKAFIYKTGLGKNMHRILKRLIFQNKTIGYFIVFEVNRTLDENHLEITDLLCNFLAFKSKNNLEEYATDKIYESLIYDLLQNKSLSDLSVTDRVHSSNWLIRPVLRLMYIEVDTLRTLTYYFDYICSQLQHINPYAKALRFEEHILVILNYNDETEYHIIFEKIMKLLKVYQLHLGISNSFSNLTNIYDHYIQAKTALTLGNILQDKTRFFYYKDYSYYHLLSCMDNRNLPGLCSPHYMLLNQYDQMNSTEYCDTLYQYILAACNLSATAKTLQIHRNTMSYRLEKIIQISEINLSSGEELYQFYTTVKIIRWLDKIEH